MLKKLLSTVFFIGFFVPLAALAQTGSIEGIVTDAETGNTIPGANVLLLEVNRGAATNTEGHYEIDNVEPGTYTLRVTFVGYETYTDQVTIESNETLEHDVQLAAGAVGLDEVVVTGFGEESRIEYTGSASSINVSEQIENVPVVNVGTALQGAASGLNITSGSGTPGSQIEFNIRGVSSINAGGEPLVVLDGVPIITDSPQFGISTDQGVLASIPPQNIQSINVLKGPVATAQYGAEGANGVIVITTKRGTAGENQYSVSYKQGIVSRAVPFPEMVNAFEYAELYREGVINAARISGDPVPDPSTITVPFAWNGTTNTIWRDYMTRDNPMTRSFQLSASGGTQQATYFGSLNYQNSESVVIGSGYKRFAGTFNFGYEFNENIDISNQFVGSFSELNGIREGSAYFANPTAAPLFMLPTAPILNEDGSIYIGPKLTQYNPLWVEKYDISRTRNYRLINSAKLNIDLLDNLAFHSEAGFDYSILTEKTYGNLVHGWAADLGGFARNVNNSIFQATLQNGFSYSYAINEDNALDARLVNTLKFYNFDQLVASGQGFATLGVTNLESASTPLLAEYSVEDGSLISFLAKVHYSYKDKVFFDGTIRREGNSRFAEGRRWGTFYGLGAGWLISAEDFLSDSEVISLLKIRASYGVSGNNAIGRNEYQALLNFDEAYAQQPAIYPGQLGNPLLTWEKKRSMEVGLQFAFFNNRIDGDVTVFRSKTYDLLYNVPLSRTTGFNEQLRNVGEMKAKGVEIGLNSQIIRNEDFAVSLGGNFTYVTNEVTQLPTDATGTELTVLDRMRYVAEGHSVREWYMRTWAGVDPQTGLPLWEVNDGDDTPGEVTSVYSEAQPEYQGATPIPTHYGSIGLNINYKGFYAGASLFGSFGNKVYYGFAEYNYSDGEYIYPSVANQLDRWQEPGDITDTPRVIAGGNNNSNGNSSRFLYDASYLRLQVLRVGYHLPSNLLNELNIGVRGVNIFVSGRNLWTYRFDDDLVWGPLVDDTGFIDVTNQAQRAFTAGINIKF